MTRSRRGNLPYVPLRKDEGEKKREKEEEKRMEVEGETGRGYPKKKKKYLGCVLNQKIFVSWSMLPFH